MSIYEKLLHIQQDLKAPKSQYNSFGDFNYRSCEDIQEAAKPLLAAQKCVLLVGDDLFLIGDRYYVKATARLIDCENGESVENVAYARETASRPKMDDAQLTGSASSYARKYALNGLFCLDDQKDADGQNKSKVNDGNKNKEIPLVDEAQMNTLKNESKRTGISINIVLGNYNLKKLEEMNDLQFKDALKRFKFYPTVLPSGTTIDPSIPESVDQEMPFK